MSHEPTIIGIDNGVSGGIAAISRSHGKLIGTASMPTVTRHHWYEKTKTKSKAGVKSKKTAIATSNEIDGWQVVKWIYGIINLKPCLIVIEECPEHADKQSIMRSMATSYGILIGAISTGLKDSRIVTVRSGNPADSWQREMLGSVKQGHTKAVALQKAKELWPDETWLRTPKCSVPDSGKVDAALIAEFARKMKL